MSVLLSAFAGAVAHADDTPDTSALALTELQADYKAALTEAILEEWNPPQSVQAGMRCRLLIQQVPGGDVMHVAVSSPCAYGEDGRVSIEAAVLKAQPLPYAGFERVFQRTLILNFEARDR